MFWTKSWICKIRQQLVGEISPMEYIEEVEDAKKRLSDKNNLGWNISDKALSEHVVVPLN